MMKTMKMDIDEVVWVEISLGSCRNMGIVD